VLTIIDCVVSPVDHTLLLAAEEVRVTVLPAQMVVDPPAVIVGVGAVVPTVTDTGADVNVGHPPTVFETV
jgi:hypothetical protein